MTISQKARGRWRTRREIDVVEGKGQAERCNPEPVRWLARRTDRGIYSGSLAQSDFIEAVRELKKETRLHP
jgi:hypothetical protein